MQLDNVKTLRDAVNYGKQFLEDFGIENAQYDATELLLLVMGISRTQYLINSMDKIDSGKLAEYAELINKRAEHIPLQHITGIVNFYGREYKVNANVLIPRQDTEILVEEVMKLTNSESRVLDMCTGSGCIIISLAASGHTSENGAVAIDISDDALKVADYNKKYNNADYIKLIKRLAAVSLWLIIWQIASVMTGLELLLASPVTVLRTLAGMLVTRQFYGILYLSVMHIMSGMLAGCLIGICAGILSARFDFLKEWLGIAVQLMKSLPVAAFIILVLMWWGSKNVTFIISAMVVIPMITTGVKEGIDNTDNKQIELARVYDMTAFNTFRYVYLTGVYPYITAQLKVAAGMCFKAGISAEIIGLVTGTIGTQMYYAKMYLLSAELFSWSIVVIVVSLVIEKCIIWLVKMHAGNPQMYGQPDLYVGTG